MRLAVSNIAWDEGEDEPVLDLLSELGVDGVEVAPTKWWPEWKGASVRAAGQRRRGLVERGFIVPALQSVLYARPEIQILGDARSRQAGITHLGEVARIAGGLGAGVMVFGSPRNRTRGSVSLSEAMERAVGFFREAGDACAPHKVSVCIEPNPAVYSCDFMTHWQEVVEMVERTDHPWVGVHLDIACIELAGDDPSEAIRTCGAQIRHFHVTEPNLGGFEAARCQHAQAAAALSEVGYDGWLSIEMRRNEDPLASIRQAVQTVQSFYA